MGLKHGGATGDGVSPHGNRVEETSITKGLAKQGSRLCRTLAYSWKGTPATFSDPDIPSLEAGGARR
jgi:hypothetical protein